MATLLLEVIIIKIVLRNLICVYLECSVVLVVDNYVVRNLRNYLSTDAIKRKYTAYFADINAYYYNNFNTKLSLAYIYIEESGSFTDTNDAGI